MPIYKTSYDTTLGSAFQTKLLTTSIKEAIITDGIELNTLGIIPSDQISALFILGVYPSESNIPMFAHPLLVEHDKKTYLCSDVRLFVKTGGQDFGGNKNPVPKNQVEFNFVKSRTVLNLAWLSGSQYAMKNSLGFGATVYAMWLSEVISKRFALDPRDQLILSVIAHYFFQSLHYSEDINNEDTKQLFTVHTMKATKASSQIVFDVFDKLGPMSNLDEFCQNVRAVLENIRLKDFNAGTLITTTGMSWFGTNAKEILAIALEHPPTWYAIVYSSLEERTYKNSMIARVAERFGKGGAWVDYKNAYAETVRQYLETDNNPSYLD